jgi:quercetin dioxygenase-like cupin family protein
MAMNNQRDDETMAEINNMVNSIDYKTGSVASKTLIDKETGTIVLFAFSEGQVFAEKKAPFDIVVSVIEGEGEIKIEGKAFTLTAGEMITIPAKKPYSLKAVKKFKTMMVMMK